MRKYTGEKSDGWYYYEYHDLNGEKQIGSTRVSPEEYIEVEASKITIKFEGKEYDTNQLKKIYGDLPLNNPLESQWDLDIENFGGDISNKKNLSGKEIEEIKNLKNKIDSRKWKSKMRALRKKGKLEQYKIDALNKLGMIWYPLGRSKSHDEWENNYISFKKYGLCYEIKNWVNEQRILYKKNSLSNENLYRLQAVNFPFNSEKKETYKLTRVSCWDLREKLEKKVKKYKSKIIKELSIDKEITKPSDNKTSRKKSSARQKEKQLKIQREQKFYENLHHFQHAVTLNKLAEKDSLKILSQINEGFTLNELLKKKFIENECIKLNKKNEKLPTYIKKALKTKSKEIIGNDKIYSQLSDFNNSHINKSIRKKACEYMLKYIPTRTLKTGKTFKEINTLILIYKQEKNLTELTFLKEMIFKYPMLEEFYGEKINVTILKLKP